MDLLKGKVALVTGASRGIGRKIAETYASEGASVAFTDLKRDENMASLEKELTAMGVKCQGYVVMQATLMQRARQSRRLWIHLVRSIFLSTMPVSPVTRFSCVWKRRCGI